MPFKKHKPEDIIGKLREVEIVLAQGTSTAEACRRQSASRQEQARRPFRPTRQFYRCDLRADHSIR